MPLQDQLSESLARNWIWVFLLGVLLLIGGLGALASPFMASVYVTVWVGLVFLFAGGAQVVQAMRAKGWKGVALSVLFGVLYVIGGLLLLFEPLKGMIALSFIIVITFVATGLVRIVLGLTLKPEDGWGWMVAGGVVAVIAGLIIWASFPGSGIWLLGLIAGVSFISEGWALVLIGLAGRKIANSDGRD